MKIKNISILILMAVTLASVTTAFSQEKVYMPFFELINIHSDYQYSTAKLLKGYMDEEKRYTLVLPQRSDSMVPQPPVEDIRAKAGSLGCPYYVVGELNRMGETVIISISMYKTDDGSKIWSDKLKANTPDDIDPILQKVARNIGTSEKAARDGDIYSVTSYQSQQLKQIQSINSFGLSVGGALFLSKPFTDDPFSAGFGAFWYYDAREILYEINAETYFVSTSGLVQGSLNAYRPIFAENNTPFFGGGLGITHMWLSDIPGTPDTIYKTSYTGSGLVLLLGGGYIIGRSSTVGIRAHLRYFIATFKMNNPEKSLPHGILLNLEIYFGR